MNFLRSVIISHTILLYAQESRTFDECREKIQTVNRQWIKAPLEAKLRDIRVRSTESRYARDLNCRGHIVNIRLKCVSVETF